MRTTTTTLITAAAVALLGCPGDSDGGVDGAGDAGALSDPGPTTTGAPDTSDPADPGPTGGDGVAPDTGGDSEATGGDEGGGVTTGTPTCPPVLADRPGAISEHAFVFDPVKERMIFFGGNPEFPVQCIGKNSYLAETWAYWPRCNQWEKLPEGPSARGRASAIYNAEHHAMVIFGGRFRPKGADPFTTPYTLYDETWWLDLTTDTWSQVEVKANSPSGRVNASAIYDPIGVRVILFGGNKSTGGASYIPLSDAWELDLTKDAWTPITTDPGPNARLFAAAVYDPINHAMVITQGGDANAFIGPFLGDTWSLDLSTYSWTKLDASGGPGPDRRIWGRAIYAPGIERVVLFGGHDDGALGNRNDMWMFDIANTAWELVALNDQFQTPGNGFCDFPSDFATITVGAPERRGSHAMVYWPQEGSVLIHGGKTDCGLIDDLWEIDLQTYEWTDHEPATVGESCLRFADPSQCTSHCN